MQTTDTEHLSHLVHDAHIPDREGASFEVAFTSRKTGATVTIRFTRAIGILGVGASGYWLAIDFGQGFEAAGSYTSAEPLRGWAFSLNKKWSKAATPAKLATAKWFAAQFNGRDFVKLGDTTSIDFI
jgi:hypothetical protein